MTTEFRHPIFARLVAFVAARAEGSEDDDLRRELLSGLHGRVVELGAGSGPNFRFYARCDGRYRRGRSSSSFAGISGAGGVRWCRFVTSRCQAFVSNPLAAACLDGAERATESPHFKQRGDAQASSSSGTGWSH
jgi:hypothetical protein